MKDYRYILEVYNGMSTRYTCPSPLCGKPKCFTRYVDTVTGEHVHPTVGRCNREVNCGYHYTPKQYFEETQIPFGLPESYRPLGVPKKAEKRPVVSFIPFEIFKRSRAGYSQNKFVQFLTTIFDAGMVNDMIGRYHIGTSKHWPGSVVFWQVDKNGKIRTGKIMLYNPDTGKRVKEPFNHITWVHRVLKPKEFNLNQCLFGEHLLRTNLSSTVAIVESEKTAIIACAYFPQFIWLAAGSLQNLKEERCKELTGRNVVLFPDVNGYERWHKIASKLHNMANFKVSDFLEQRANPSERKLGFDLADYLVKFNYKQFHDWE